MIMMRMTDGVDNDDGHDDVNDDDNDWRLVWEDPRRRGERERGERERCEHSREPWENIYGCNVIDVHCVSVKKAEIWKNKQPYFSLNHIAAPTTIPLHNVDHLFDDLFIC